jgi:TRAP-type mannitol/chloroaromatic compound transport system permease small subunit
VSSLLVLAGHIARAGTWFGGGLIIASAFLVGVEVVIRKAFALTIGGADELSGFALAISTSWALAFTLLERAHIRIDSLYIHLPVRLCALLDVLGLTLFTAFVGLIAWHGYGVFQTTLRLDAHSVSPLGTPLVWPQLLWVAGLVMFLAIASLLLARALAALVTGDLAMVQRLAGSRTVSEEVASELGEVAASEADEPGERQR